MGKRYGHVTIEERCEIACLQAEGRSVRQIAADLDRSPSTVARELKRNGSQTGEYKPVYADQQARARRWRGSGMERDETLRARVLSHLAQGWSPEQVAGRLELEAGRVVISYESIYRFIYGQRARTKDYGWRHYLPRGKSKRGWRGRKGGSPASLMAMRRPIAERPLSAGDRRTPGHWEADLMLFRTYGHAVLTMHERHSRILIAVRPPGKASSPSPAPCRRCSVSCRPNGDGRLPSTTGPSSPSITDSTIWVSKPSSAIPTPLGRRAGWRTPSAGCDGLCPARPTWRRCRWSGIHR